MHEEVKRGIENERKKRIDKKFRAIEPNKHLVRAEPPIQVTVKDHLVIDYVWNAVTLIYNKDTLQKVTFNKLPYEESMKLTFRHYFMTYWLQLSKDQRQAMTWDENQLGIETRDNFSKSNLTDESETEADEADKFPVVRENTALY